MRPQLEIRPAREEDAVSLCAIFNEAVLDHLDTFDADPRVIDDQRAVIAVAEQDPKHPILVADVRNWIAGWVALAPYDSRIALDDIGEVFIYVRRSFRSYGVGRQLLRAIQESAGRLGYRKLIGRILVENRDGLLLCRATGWREVGRHSAHARLNGTLHDVMLQIGAHSGVAPLPHSAADAEAAPGTLRVLVADDNSLNQNLLRRLVSSLGHKVDVVSNGQEAVAAVAQHPYDVVLMDVLMPEMDGLAAAEAICRRWPRGNRPRLVALTGMAGPGDRERCLKAGYDDYMSKPVHLAELVETFNTVSGSRTRLEPSGR